MKGYNLYVYVRSPKHVVLIFLVLLVGVSSFLYYPRRQAEQAMTERLAAMLSGNSPFVLEERTKSAGCVFKDNLPDGACTPGAIFAEAIVERVCEPGYSKTVRNVTQKLRKAVFAEYGVSYPQPRGAFEVDHLIPLALGGNNDIANLFPQPAEPAPGFREKDIVENYLHEEVCSGRVSLSAAQKQIAYDWLAIYKNLAPEQIEKIKTRFRNWSQ